MAATGSKKDFQEIFAYYKDIVSKENPKDPNDSKTLVLPIIPEPVLISLCMQISQIFDSEPILITVKSPVLIVGDLHGHLLDLLRILKQFGYPPEKHYVFLGDLVDRGEFSTEVVTLVFILKVLFPRQVTIIRGNHEFSSLCHSNGFSYEISHIYNSDFIEIAFYRAFSFMPLGALIGTHVLCVHGGIGPSFTSLAQIRSIQRPFDNFDSEIISSILWSDPSNDVEDFQQSDRGEGYLYGTKNLETFLSQNQLRYLVRGHECIENGVDISLDSKCITVFSASNYCGVSSNKAGILLMQPSGSFEIVTYPPLAYLKRNLAGFMPSESENSFEPLFPGGRIQTKKLLGKRSEKASSLVFPPQKSLKSSSSMGQVNVLPSISNPLERPVTSREKIKCNSEKLMPPKMILPSMRKTTSTRIPSTRKKTQMPTHF